MLSQQVHTQHEKPSPQQFTVLHRLTVPVTDGSRQPQEGLMHGALAGIGLGLGYCGDGIVETRKQARQ